MIPPKMLAFRFVEVGKWELAEVAVPQPAAGEALVRVSATSLCATDLKILSGALEVAPGRVTGHEGVGVVAAVGPGVNPVIVGKRVLIPSDTPCGKCDDCLANWNGLGCQTGDTINAFHLGLKQDGTHAEYVNVPYADSNLGLIPDTVSDAQALMLCCVGTTGLSSIERADTQLGDVVAIVGQGPVGLFATMGARLRGASLIAVIDPLEDRRRCGLEFGADVAWNPDDVDVVAELSAITGGRMADVAVEAVGIQQTFETTVRLARPAGAISIVGNFGVRDGYLRLPLDAGAFMGGIGCKRIISTSSPGGRDRTRRLLELTARSRLDASKLVTHQFSLHDIPSAVDTFKDKSSGVLKILIECGVSQGRDVDVGEVATA